MELEQLRHFTAAAEAGSFSAAARSLYISHSTICRSVSALEEELGVQLLERHKLVVYFIFKLIGSLRNLS